MTVLNTTNISSVAFIGERKGTYRAIVKVRAGFVSGVDDNTSSPRWKSAIDVFRSFKKGALQTIEFRPEGGDYWLTVFAKKGTKIILMDETMFQDMVVGDINQDWFNTNLYGQGQYTAVNAKTWASKAFVINE
jgi:hypothetical protein